MRFNSQAYDKVFPRKAEVEHVESAVETFKPSEETEPEVEESSVGTEPDVLDPLLDGEPSNEEGGGADGNGNNGEPNNE